jgi:hypothetical protein
MSAEAVMFSDYRVDDDGHCEIDLSTAVDVAIRDLGEILLCWGSELARRQSFVAMARTETKGEFGVPDCFR